MRRPPGFPSPNPLAACPLFQGLTAREIEEVAGLSRERRARRRATFFQEGQPATAFFVLRSGRVKVSQVSPDGQQVILRVLGPGEMFGGFGALIGAPYPATAEALEASVAASWDKADMEALLARVPGVACNLVNVLARRLKEMEERYRELATERVAQRIARTLLRLVRQSGRKTTAGIAVDLPLSREELAQMSGTTLFTVSRLLSQWEAEGILASGRGRLLVRDPHGLVKRAEDLP